MLCISLRSSIKYPEDSCIRQNFERQKLTNVCFPVAELFWFCAQLYINYCFKCKQTWGGFWEKQHTQRIVVVAMCPLMIINWSWLRPQQCEQILQTDKNKCSDNDEYYDDTYIHTNIQSHCPWSLERWSTTSRHHHTPSLWREGFCTGSQTQPPCLCAWCVRTAQFALQHHSVARAQMTTHSQPGTLKLADKKKSVSALTSHDWSRFTEYNDYRTRSRSFHLQNELTKSS